MSTSSASVLQRAASRLLFTFPPASVLDQIYDAFDRGQPKIAMKLCQRRDLGKYALVRALHGLALVRLGKQAEVRRLFPPPVLLSISFVLLSHFTASVPLLH